MKGRGEEIVHHPGGSVGGRTVLWITRDRGLVVRVAANLSEAPVEPGLAEAIGGLFLVAGEADRPPATGSAPSPSGPATRPR